MRTGYAVNRVVNTQERDRRLESGLQAPHLAHCRLEHTRCNVVPHLPIKQVEPVSRQHLLRISRGGVLRRVVVRSQLSDEVGRVLRCVHGELFRDNEKRIGELGDRQLFSRPLQYE